MYFLHCSSDSSSLVSIMFILHNCKSNELDVNCHLFFKCGIGIKIFTVGRLEKNSVCELGSFSSSETWVEGGGGRNFFKLSGT